MLLSSLRKTATLGQLHGRTHPTTRIDEVDQTCAWYTHSPDNIYLEGSVPHFPVTHQYSRYETRSPALLVQLAPHDHATLRSHVMAYRWAKRSNRLAYILAHGRIYEGTAHTHSVTCWREVASIRDMVYLFHYWLPDSAQMTSGLKMTYCESLTSLFVFRDARGLICLEASWFYLILQRVCSYCLDPDGLL